MNAENPKISYISDVTELVSGDRTLELHDTTKIGPSSRDYLTPAMHHSDTLFDEEDKKNPDAATGRVARPLADEAMRDLSAVDATEAMSRRALDAAMGMDNDAAARWLADNDPDNI